MALDTAAAVGEEEAAALDQVLQHKEDTLVVSHHPAVVVDLEPSLVVAPPSSQEEMDHQVVEQTRSTLPTVSPEPLPRTVNNTLSHLIYV